MSLSCGGLSPRQQPPWRSKCVWPVAAAPSLWLPEDDAIRRAMATAFASTTTAAAWRAGRERPDSTQSHVAPTVSQRASASDHRHDPDRRRSVPH